jgi:hypothetical protein
MRSIRPGLATGVAMTLLIAAALGALPFTQARLTATQTSTGSFTTGSLAAPTSLSGTGGLSVALNWTASSSSSATGYSVLRSATNGSGYAQVSTVTPVTATSTTDGPHAGTWYYVLQTYLQSWTSANSNQASAIVAAGSTGFKPCTANAAVTTLSGDNNGFETSPGNACANDAAVATDANSGTGTSTSCSDTGKDRHRYWGYTFNLPASPTSIDGILVQLKAAISSTFSTQQMCVELSWDSGTTWTTAKTQVLTTSLATYTLGSTSDKWGRTSWAVSELGTSTFRVRVTDVAASTFRTFTLDWLGVSVQYTP